LETWKEGCCCSIETQRTIGIQTQKTLPQTQTWHPFGCQERKEGSIPCQNRQETSLLGNRQEKEQQEDSKNLEGNPQEEKDQIIFSLEIEAIQENQMHSSISKTPWSMETIQETLPKEPKTCNQKTVRQEDQIRTRIVQDQKTYPLGQDKKDRTILQEKHPSQIIHTQNPH
jgi:hypothetical protein